MAGQARISLCYDGGHISHLETVVPHLSLAGLRGTFYVEPTDLLDDVMEWREVGAAGHEVGDGSLLGACLPDGSLPSWTLEMILEEVSSARELLSDVIPDQPVTTALPWGKAICSDCIDYAPILSEEVGAVRTGGVGRNREGDSLLKILPMVGLSGPQMMEVVTLAQEAGEWAILAFGGVGSGDKSVDVQAHQELLDFLTYHKAEVEVAPVVQFAVSGSRTGFPFRVV